MKYSVIAGYDKNNKVLSIGRHGFVKLETALKIAKKEQIKDATLYYHKTDVRGNFYTVKEQQIMEREQ